MVTQIDIKEGLKMHVSSDWASSVPNFRKKIKKEIINSTDNISISHCPLMGGFGMSSSWEIGFDLEVKSRCSLKLVERISPELKEESVFKDGLFHFIWSIKEAGFKCFSQETSVNVLSDVKVISFENDGLGTIQVKGFRAYYSVGMINSEVQYALVWREV